MTKKQRTDGGWRVAQAVLSRDGRITKLEQRPQEKNKRIRQLEYAVHNRDEELVYLDEEVGQLTTRLEQSDNRIAAAEAATAVTRAESAA